MADTFAVIVRMMWIDDVVDSEGQINRADIMRAFAISAPQASLDLRRYMATNPRRIAYDVRAKTYVQIEGTKPLFDRDSRVAAEEIVYRVRKVLNGNCAGSGG